MYLCDVTIRLDESLIDAPFYQKGFCNKFSKQVFLITCYFEELIFRKIKHDSIKKIIVQFFPNPPIDGKFRVDNCLENKYVDYGITLCVNTFFDFQRYMLLENDLDKCQAITDVFEEELLKAFDENGFEGSPAAKRAIDEIRENNYVYRSSFGGNVVNYHYSPNRTYKVFFRFVWKFSAFEVWINVRKPRGKRDLYECCVGVFKPHYCILSVCFSSVEWLSETKFIVNLHDMSGNKHIVDIAEGSVQVYDDP